MNVPNKTAVQFVPNLRDARFFTVPKNNSTFDELKTETHIQHIEVGKQTRKGKNSMRYPAYIRISSEEQIGNFSVDAQRRVIEAWVKAQSGKIVKIYTDEAQSGRTIDRPEFQNMRRDAKKGKFDAIVVHKFDRFARNRTDALAIKSLLRQEYGIKVFSASEPSEDSDGAIGALIEGIMECVADWYSRNLSNETMKGKREKALQGFHNNQPPFGLNKTREGVLYPNDDELVGLRLAFELYATGNYSDNEVARTLNENGFVNRKGKLFCTETVRDILQNRTYLGFVKYQHNTYHSGNRRTPSKPTEWIKGKHEGVIDQALFDRCQEIRHAKAVHHEYYPKYRVFLLRDIVFCAECVANMPAHEQDNEYGKMRCQSAHGHLIYYRCRARDFGCICSQTSVRSELVEAQVVNILKGLKPQKIGA